jgi:hypothetical protein
MKRSLAVMLVSIMLVSIGSLALAQGEKYTPVSKVEEWYLNKGYNPIEFKDSLYDKRLVYFKDGTAATTQTYKRIVTFKTSSSTVKPVRGEDYGITGEKYGGWTVEESSGNTVKLTLYYVTRRVSVTVKVTREVEKKIPVSLETKQVTTPPPPPPPPPPPTQVPIGIETK